MSRSGAWEGRVVEGTFMDGQRGRFYLKRGNFPHYLPLSNRVINLSHESRRSEKRHDGRVYGVGC